ncbi:hypothetical protein LT493_15025 [Streptomyces tricolor]|nr:hypothetical protein [Streptomyces tricolor]
MGRQLAADRHRGREPHRPQPGRHRQGPARHRPHPGRGAGRGHRAGGDARGPARGGRGGVRGEDRLRPAPTGHALPVLQGPPAADPGLARGERAARARADAATGGGCAPTESGGPGYPPGKRTLRRSREDP